MIAVQRSAQRLWFPAVGVLFLLGLDQAVKTLARSMPVGSSVQLLPFVSFVHVQNTGALWGWGVGLNAWFAALSVLVLVLLFFFRSQLPCSTCAGSVAWVFLVAGVAGNLVDRVFFGAVTDWLRIGWWPSFNLADGYLNIGVWVCVVSFIVEEGKRSRGASRQGTFARGSALNKKVLPRRKKEFEEKNQGRKKSG